MVSSITRSTASGSTAVFSVPFPYLDKTHVQVRLDGVLKTLGVDFSFLTASTIQISAGNPASGTVVERKRVTPTDPLTSFSPGNLDTGDLNVGILQPLYIAQEAGDHAADLELRGWYTENFGMGGAVPLPEADKVLGWNAAGDALENKTVVDLGAIEILDEDDMASDSSSKVPTQQSVKAYADTKLAKSQNLSDLPDAVTGLSNLRYQRVPADAAFAVISAMTKMSQRMDLRDWNGLDLTDNNDNATLLAAALVASGSGGQTLHIPSGKIALGSEVVMPVFAKIQGEGRMSSIYGGIAYVDQKATVLHFGHTGKGLTLTGPGARSIKGITTYRTQPTPSATIPTAYTPTAHDFDIYMTAVQDVVLDEIMLLNPTKGICAIGDATLGGNNRIDFGRIKGQPLSVGIELHHCYDVVFGENIQFWPYWTNNMNVRQHMRTNAKALSWSRVDGPAFGRFFSIGYRHGLFVDNDSSLGGSTPGGTVSKGRVEMLFADSAASALWIENTTTAANLSFGAFYGQSGTEGAWTTDSYLVRDRGTNSRVDFGHLELVLAHNQMVNMDGTGGTMQADKVQIDRWDTGTLGAGAFLVQGTNNRLSLGPVTRVSPPAADPYQTSGTNPILETPDWRTYAATVTAISGTLTTVGTVATRYQRRGKVMKVSIDVTITDIGTGTAGINVTMPAASVSPATGIWKNTATNASGVIALLGASSTAAITAFPVANGQRFLGSIEYEVA